MIILCQQQYVSSGYKVKCDKVRVAGAEKLFPFGFILPEAIRISTTYTHNFITCLRWSICTLYHAELNDIFQNKKGQKNRRSFSNERPDIRKRVERTFRLEKATLSITGKYVTPHVTFALVGEIC